MGITRLVRAAAATLAISASVGSHAEGDKAALANGNDLLRICDSSSATYNLTYCIGYIAGVYRGFVDASAVANKKFICLPATVEMGQGRLIVVKYLQENPERLTQDSDWLIIYALTKAFPCPRT